MSSSPTLACSRWCSSSRASGARLFSPAWPAARNWSRHWEARAAVIPNSPRPRLEILASQQAEYRRAFTPGRKPPLPVTLGGRSSRPPGALRRRRFFNLLPHLDTPPARTLSQSRVQENSRAQDCPGRRRRSATPRLPARPAGRGPGCSERFRRACRPRTPPAGPDATFAACESLPRLRPTAVRAATAARPAAAHRQAPAPAPSGSRR